MEGSSTLCEREETCSVCLGRELEEVISLPRFPFTGIYCSDQTKLPDPIYAGLDQALMRCPDCGHAQLKSVIHPELVYNNTYAHRGSMSPLSKQGNEFFAQFLEKIFSKKIFRRIVDIGCNDGFLLKQLEEKGQKLFGIDPIWAGKDHSISPKISIVGGFVEKVDLRGILNEEDCLVVSAHTFEHIAHPREVLETLLRNARPNTVFVIEVPCFDTLVYTRRFDQIFHQHLQYFSQASLLRLVEELGCSYIAHTFNRSLWGGTLLFAFTNSPKINPAKEFSKIHQNEIKNNYSQFRHSLEILAQAIAEKPNEPFYGFGAAQMVPSLVYHVPGQLREIGQILDDSVERQGLSYPYLPFKIVSPNRVDVKEANVVITALDSARPILERLIKLRPKHIFIPLQII